MKKILVACPGLGRIHRGYESFAREVFEELRDTGSFELILAKGGGPRNADERRIVSLCRSSLLSRVLGTCVGRDAYAVEQLSFALGLLPALFQEQPDAVFLSDGQLCNILWRWKILFRFRYALVLSNGAPYVQHLPRCDLVQHLTPEIYQDADAREDGHRRHVLLPYGYRLRPEFEPIDPEERQELKLKLGLPLDKVVILSVGALNASHKRMDYLLREFALADNRELHLVILGAKTGESSAVMQLAHELLPEGQRTVRTVPAEEVEDYYRVAGCFVLCSLSEGMGRVYVEALSYGLPCIVHDSPVTRFVLGEHGTFVDCTQEGAVARELLSLEADMESELIAERRHRSVYQRFSWDVLLPQYRSMFERCWEREECQG